MRRARLVGRAVWLFPSRSRQEATERKREK
uniref:Uncharacterized protein n=1 Tax=Siphoviridae sp. ctNU74 TaxID=2825471 RepID=A0A8S5NZ29_9CAUD|nr:MAG TPA: hypothetical protein [Siphoviridae sp. ctNU74]